MLRIEQVLGSRLDPAFAERIHELEHQGAVDLLTVPAADVARRWNARSAMRRFPAGWEIRPTHAPIPS